ncbi:MAG: lipoyl protein ligase domain-containing protein [Microthrixaceae bacterium]
MPENLQPSPSLVALAADRGWGLEVLSATAGALHAEPVQPIRSLRVNLVTGPSLVLGSSQSGIAAAPPAGVEVVVRRSGGGAVWLEPGSQVWVDVVIPTDDVEFTQDVGLSSLWLGAAWAQCVGRGAVVWQGGMQHRQEGSLACFAGVGPGEVLADGRKVVGISQRRTRELARFQCVAYLRWEPSKLIEALECPPEVRNRLETAAGELPESGGLWDTVERLVAALP